MSNNHFQCIGIVGQPRYKKSFLTHKILYTWLKKKYDVIVEKKIADKLNIQNIKTGDLNYIGKYADLVIVIGGDGNMLEIAKVLAYFNVKIIGVNRGNLGFLTDLDPNNFKNQLKKVLEGQYFSETRFLLEIKIKKKKYNYNSFVTTAMNEVVLHSKKVACMIEFEVYIDEKFAFSQRSNGLIISTPTGSTAYSLSAGGPILSPSLDAITLVPMFPHTLSSRPLVISSNSIIQLIFSYKQRKIGISCDSQINFSIKNDTEVTISRSQYYLNLIHPVNYQYFNVLISKLGWSKKLF